MISFVVLCARAQIDLRLLLAGTQVRFKYDVLPTNLGELLRTIVSDKGQVVIPKELRDRIGLRPGTVLRVTAEGKRVILEPSEEPPREVFVRAGSQITENALREAKAGSDKTARLLRDLGVLLG